MHDFSTENLHAKLKVKHPPLFVVILEFSFVLQDKFFFVGRALLPVNKIYQQQEKYFYGYVISSHVIRVGITKKG